MSGKYPGRYQRRRRNEEEYVYDGENYYLETEGSETYVERVQNCGSPYEEEENYEVYRLETQEGRNNEMIWSDDEEYDAGPESEEETGDGDGCKRQGCDDQIERGEKRELIEALYRRVESLEKKLERKEGDRVKYRRTSEKKDSYPEQQMGEHEEGQF